MIRIQLTHKTKAPLVTQRFIDRIYRITAQFVPYPPEFTVSVVTVNHQTMRQLNQQYRSITSTTDVLSFPYGDSMGEIVLCYPQALAQAKAKQVAPQRELSWLLIHGLLHLLGYDHEIPADAKVMRPLEQTILAHV